MFWVKFPIVWSLTRVKCPGIAGRGGWVVLELTGTLATLTQPLCGLKFRCSFARLPIFYPKTHEVALCQVYPFPRREQNNLLLLQRELQVLFSHERLTFPLRDVVLRATSTPQAKLLWTCKFQVCQHLSTWAVFK